MKKQTKLGLVLAAAAVLSVSVASLVSARGWVQNGADWFYVDNNGEYVTETIQASGNAKFYLGEDGAMQKDFFLEDFDGNTYYFGSNGAMVTNTWVAVEAGNVENQGDYVPDNYWYYFQASGKAMKGSSSSPKKTTIDGKKYMFNEFGQMCTGWVDNEGKVINPDDDKNPFSNAMYYAGGDNDGVLRAGWVTYYDGYDDGDGFLADKTNMYFYFNTTNNKKTGNENDGPVTKKINGKTYAFTNEGIMMTGWEAFNGNIEGQTPSGFADKTVYLSGEDDGHQVKKGWVYAVPDSAIDTSAYGDGEEKYMYFGSSGDITRDQFKKINGKFYVFNRKGIMKTGLVIWCPNGTGADHYRYVDTLDLDYATGEELTKKGILRTDDGADDYMRVTPEGRVVKLENSTYGDVAVNDVIRLHLMGEDGARKTGTNNVEFSDDTFSFQSSASGNKPSGTSAKKYYALGVLLKASADIRYGIYNNVTPSELGINEPGVQFGPQGNANGLSSAGNYFDALAKDYYFVLTTSGTKQKGNNTAKKDADGNYWYIQKSTSTLKGIWDVNVKAADRMTFDTTTLPYGTAYSYLVNGSASCADSPIGFRETFFHDDTQTKNSAMWTKKFELRKKSDSEWYFEAKNCAGMFFQADYGDKSNAWLPFGALDAGNKTCFMPEEGDMSVYGHEITPTNDYFLNCYWVD